MVCVEDHSGLFDKIQKKKQNKNKMKQKTKTKQIKIEKKFTLYVR